MNEIRTEICSGVQSLIYLTHRAGSGLRMYNFPCDRKSGTDKNRFSHIFYREVI